MSWRIIGTESLDPDEIKRYGWDGRRIADVSWVDGTGLVAAPGSEWVLEKLKQIDGQIAHLGGSAVTPGPFTVDLRDRAAAYWGVVSVLYMVTEVEGDRPDPLWPPQPPGVIN